MAGEESWPKELIHLSVKKLVENFPESCQKAAGVEVKQSLVAVLK